MIPDHFQKASLGSKHVFAQKDKCQPIMIAETYHHRHSDMSTSTQKRTEYYDISKSSRTDQEEPDIHDVHSTELEQMYDFNCRDLDLIQRKLEYEGTDFEESHMYITEHELTSEVLHNTTFTLS